MTLGWLMAAASAVPGFAADNTAGSLAPLSARFAPSAGGEAPTTDEVPDFQKHVSPLLGRLGCNGRACHGSFQGRGGFRLSLFGYDFTADYAALCENDRINKKSVLESQMLTKPIDADNHEGGKRFDVGSWEYWTIRRWLESDAPFKTEQIQKIAKLEITPAAVSFTSNDQKQKLRVIAEWQDGQREDVTCLCRFSTNDPAIASINEQGEITSTGAGDTHVVVCYDNAVVPVEVLQPLTDKIGPKYPAVAVRTRVDELVQQKLARIGVIPSPVCSDEEFLRRVSLDLTGTLPTAEEVVRFAADKNTEKRRDKIDELMRRPGYAAQWATFFCDMTGNNDEQLRNFLPSNKGNNAANQWYQWISKRVADNVPYDKLVEGIVTAESRLPDESYSDYCRAMSDICRDGSGEKYADRPGMVYYWARNNVRTAEERAISFAYTFLGVRIQCAQCHKHPFDQWTQSDFADFERLFNGIQANQNTLAPDAKKTFNEMLVELGVDKNAKGNQLRKEIGPMLDSGKTIPFPELVVNSKASNPKDKEKDKDKAAKKNKNAKPETPKARMLGGDWVTLDQKDVRGKLMSWLRDPSNPYFAKALVNRVWTHYFSIGIISPADDLSLANAPSNAPLLDHLTHGFIESGFDLKWLHREILNSDTYQRSWQPNETNKLDKRNFSHSLLRRLPAEASYDSVWMALADDDLSRDIAQNGRPRALTLAGFSPEIRGGNDTTYALAVFGRSIRESNCDCDRSNDPSLLQTVFLLNDTSVHKMLSDTKAGWAASVAEKYGWPQKNSPTNDKDRERFIAFQSSYDKQLPKIDERLAKARKDDDKAQIADLEKRRSKLVEQYERYAAKFDKEDLEAMQKKAGTPADATVGIKDKMITEEQAEWIIHEAYLRALSRHPTSEEFSTAKNFLQSQVDRTGAVESLIWSLVNTKEFILNH